MCMQVFERHNHLSKIEASHVLFKIGEGADQFWQVATNHVFHDLEIRMCFRQQWKFKGEIKKKMESEKKKK